MIDKEPPSHSDERGAGQTADRFAPASNRAEQHCDHRVAEGAKE